MASFERIVVVDLDRATVVRFVDRKITDEANIEQMGSELNTLVDEQQKTSLLLNFDGVDFLSSAALNKLITLHSKVRKLSGKMRLCSLNPQIMEVFTITRLDRMFDIDKTEEVALRNF